jgi:thiamine transporter ThiT
MLSILSIAIVISILQLCAVTYTRFGSFTFDLQLIGLVFFSFRYGFKTGLVLGLFFGMLSGVFGTESFWQSIFLYAFLGFSIGRAGEWFYKENLPAFLLMIFCACAFIYFAGNPNHSFRLFLPLAAYNMLISIFLFYFLKELLKT